MTDTPEARRSGLSRVYWLAVLIWAFAAFYIGTYASDRMKFRINDLSRIPGAGMIMRDTEGTFYHVNDDGRARSVFPELDTASYRDACQDCQLVTGEQLSQTNQFCIAGIPSRLPEIQFEIPCRSWAPIGEGPRVVTVAIFLLPMLLIPLWRVIREAFTNTGPITQRAPSRSS